MPAVDRIATKAARVGRYVPPELSAPRRTALFVLFAALLLSLAARTAFSFWEPAFDGMIRFDDVRSLGSSYWPMNLYVGGPGYAVSWVAAAVFMVLLGRGRSASLNLLGAILAGLGGIVFALVITAEVLPFAYAADPTVMAEAEGRALFEVLNDQFHLLIPTVIGGSVAIALGVLLVFGTAVRTGSMPRWFAWAGITYVIVFLGLPLEALPRVVTVIGYLIQVGLVAGLGWFGLRAGLRTYPIPISGPIATAGRGVLTRGDTHDRRSNHHLRR